MPDAPDAGAGAAAGGAQDAPGGDAGTPTPPAFDGAQGAVQDGGADGTAALRREAAARRVQLREVEAERDALRLRVDAADRAAVERLAADRLHDPADLFASTGLDALRDGDAIDPDRVIAAIDALVAAKPHYAIERRVPDFDAGVRASTAPAAPSFGAALKDAARSGSR